MSVGIERLILCLIHWRLEGRALLQGVWRRSLMSYGMILGFVLLFLVVPLNVLKQVAEKPVES